MPGPRPQKNLTQGGWSTFSYFGMTSGESQIAAAANIGTSQLNISGPGDFQIQSGTGRLDELLIFSRYTSGAGANIVFYDAAVATSGGPIVASGHKILAIIPNTLSLVSGQLPTPAVSGVSTSFSPQIGPIPIGMPFVSGLCVNLKSGGSPFTITFSPEVPSIF
jgi:hypothetical protein